MRGKCLLFSYEYKDNVYFNQDGSVDVNSIQMDRIAQPDFEFDIEYKCHSWYPLKDGYLPARDPQGLGKFPWNRPQHWTAFPPTTRAGWRGHFVLWSRLKEMPNIIDLTDGDDDACPCSCK